MKLPYIMEERLPSGEGPLPFPAEQGEDDPESAIVFRSSSPNMAREMRTCRSAVVKLHDTLSATPGAADHLLKAMSALYKWAIRRDHVTCENPARDMQRNRVKTGGFAAWEAEDFALYLKTHAPARWHAAP